MTGISRPADLTPPQHGRIVQLDGLRAIAVGAVFLQHALKAPLWMGVDLFFVLSGLLITGILLDRKARGQSYFSHFYAFVTQPGSTPMTAEYASATVRQTFNASSPVTRHTTVPASFVLIQRINLGLYALLGQLGARADWRRLAEDVWPWVDVEPSTELGRREAAWRATGGGARPPGDQNR